MRRICTIFLHKVLKFAPVFMGVLVFFMPDAAYAKWGLIDSFNLAPFVPMVLDSMMMVATGAYEFFVGNGTGIVYIMVWGFVTVSIALYLVKMYFPKNWVSFFGFSGGGEMVNGTLHPMQMGTNLLKPLIRATVAVTILLQVQPVFITKLLINPFLEFGAIYTNGILRTINTNGETSLNISCPQDILDKGWVSEDSCNFLVQPVAEISSVNNMAIKRGFDYLERGLSGLMGFNMLSPDINNFINIITGILLIITFVSCNMFMALLIIQGIFNFGMQLVLYPFNVLMWVAKPKNPDKWFDLWPPFSGIIKSLQQIVITMISCAFILCINIAVIKALFNDNTSVFSVAAGGSASGNIPNAAGGAAGFGQHSILWLSTILTFYLMLRIFELTRKQLKDYTSNASEDLYNKVKGDAKYTWNKGVEMYNKAGQAPGIAKKIGKGAVATYEGAKWVGSKTWDGMKWTGSKIGGIFR